jgi:hypothetical protein
LTAEPGGTASSRRRQNQCFIYLFCAIRASFPKLVGILLFVPGENGCWRRSVIPPGHAGPTMIRMGWWGKKAACMNVEGGQLAKLVTLSRRQIKEDSRLESPSRGTPHDLPPPLLSRADTAHSESVRSYTRRRERKKKRKKKAVKVGILLSPFHFTSSQPQVPGRYFEPRPV